jgi:hypothetical protein
MFLLDLCAGNLATDDEMEIRLTSEKISKRAREMTNVLESESCCRCFHEGVHVSLTASSTTKQAP